MLQTMRNVRITIAAGLATLSAVADTPNVRSAEALNASSKILAAAAPRLTTV
jgi:hypothetical protein